MSGITNKNLEILCKKYLNKNFLGVFPSDVSPNSKRKENSIVFNLSAHDEEGTHFVAVIKHINKIIYFDPFGKICNNEDIIKYMKKYNLPIEFNETKIQSDTSSLCGYFCFYFLYNCFLQKKSLTFFIKKFSKNLILNDSKLMKYILNVIKK